MKDARDQSKVTEFAIFSRFRESCSHNCSDCLNVEFQSISRNAWLILISALDNCRVKSLCRIDPIRTDKVPSRIGLP